MIPDARLIQLKHELLDCYHGHGWVPLDSFDPNVAANGPACQAMVQRVQQTLIGYANPTGQFDLRTQDYLDRVYGHVPPLCPQPPFVAAGSVPTHGTRDAKYFVCHVTEGHGTTADLASYFRSSGGGLGVTFATAPDGTCSQFCDLNAYTWHVVAHNSECIGMEQIGFEQPRSWWDGPGQAQLLVGAWVCAWACQRLGIDLAPAGSAATGRAFTRSSGITQHLWVPDNDHTDCGPGFPFDEFIGLVKQMAVGGPTQAQRSVIAAAHS